MCIASYSFEKLCGKLFLSNEKVVMNTTRSERAYKTSVYQRREYKIKHSNIANNKASLLHKTYDVDIGPAGSTYFRYRYRKRGRI